MTKQTERAIALTKELFNDGKFHSEDSWDRAIRTPNFNPTLKTTLKYLPHDEFEKASTWYGTPTKFFKLK